MDCGKIGRFIYTLRREKGLTQKQLAQQLYLSDKTISKWETGKGYPDISLLEPIAKIFEISITELLSGNTINNVNVSANMLRSKFYGFSYYVYNCVFLTCLLSLNFPFFILSSIR